MVFFCFMFLFFLVMEMERYEEKWIARYAKVGNTTLLNLLDLNLRMFFEGHFGRTIIYCLKLREPRAPWSFWAAGCSSRESSRGTNKKQAGAFGRIWWARKSQQRIWNRAGRAQMRFQRTICSLLFEI